MNNMERICQIDRILGARHCVTRKELQERLGVSWATLKRDLAYMRDRLNAPIRFDRNLGGYRFEKAGQRVGAHHELPGLWFSAEEIHALLTMHHLLSNLDTGGLLGPQIRPLLARLTGLLGSADNPAEEVQRRIRIQTVGARELHLDHFQSVGSALLRRKRLLIRYHARGTDELTNDTDRRVTMTNLPSPARWRGVGGERNSHGLHHPECPAKPRPLARFGRRDRNPGISRPSAIRPIQPCSGCARPP